MCNCVLALPSQDRPAALRYVPDYSYLGKTSRRMPVIAGI
jgi:hypothetical protein